MVMEVGKRIDCIKVYSGVGFYECPDVGCETRKGVSDDPTIFSPGSLWLELSGGKPAWGGLLTVQV